MNDRRMAACRRTQRLSSELGLRFGGHLALTDLRSEDPIELSHLLCHDDSAQTLKLLVIVITFSFASTKQQTPNINAKRKSNKYF